MVNHNNAVGRKKEGRKETRKVARVNSSTQQPSCCVGGTGAGAGGGYLVRGTGSWELEACLVKSPPHSPSRFVLIKLNTE